MNFGLTYEQQAIGDVARKLAAELLSDAARDAEKASRVPHRIWLKLAETGLMPAVPADHGGGGIPDALAFSIAIEALAHGDPAITAAVAWNANAALLIGKCGSPHQRSNYLPLFVSDPHLRGAVALYEGFGRAPSEYETRIDANADGSWRIAGRKAGVVNGASADPLLVVGRDVNGRIRAVMVSTKEGGVTVESSAALIGLAAARMAVLRFDVTVPSDRLLGGVEADPAALVAAIAQLRLTTASIALGCARRACEYASNYATERIAFGRPIAGFQGVAFMMAEAEVQLNAARLEVYDVASQLEESLPDDIEKTIAHTIAYACSIAAKVTRDSVQVLGGHGFITDHPVERWYRAAAALCALDFDVLHSSFAPSL